jgi:hypothetical protein
MVENLQIWNLRICNLRICNLRICNLRICNLRICNLRICNLRVNQEKFADSHISEICGLGIADWAQEFADLKKQLCFHLCKFATGVNDTGGKLPLVSTTPAVNLPPVSRCTLSCEYFCEFSNKLAESTETSPPPPHTQVTYEYILRVEGVISRAIPRKCSPLGQIRREQKKPGPLLVVYFMVYSESRL